MPLPWKQYVVEADSLNLLKPFGETTQTQARSGISFIKEIRKKWR
jgi:hypothetical protein